MGRNRFIGIDERKRGNPSDAITCRSIRRHIWNPFKRTNAKSWIWRRRAAETRAGQLRKVAGIIQDNSRYPRRQTEIDFGICLDGLKTERRQGYRIRV